MTLPETTLMLESLGWILVHSVWQFTAIALLAAAADRLLRGGAASIRYNVLLIPLAGFVVSAAATGVSAVRSIQVERPATLVATVAENSAGSNRLAEAAPRASIAGGASNGLAASTESKSWLGFDQLAGIRGGIWLDWRASVQQAIRPWFGGLVALWLFGASGFALRPLIGLHTVRRLRTTGVNPATGQVESSLFRFYQLLGVDRCVRVLESTVVQMPVVVGWLRPTILLPVSLVSGLTALQLDAILLHELAHVRRNDYVVNLAQVAIETLLFYHPAVWWLSRRIRDVRELCCDDLAAAALGNRFEYGRALVAVEEHRERVPVLLMGVRGGSVLHRIERLIQSDKHEPIPGLAGSALAGVCLFFAGAVTVGAWSDGKREAPRPPVVNGAERAKLQSPEVKSDEAAPDEKPVVNRGIESLNIVIAENVIVWDGEVVSWDEVVDRLRATRKKLGAPIHPHLYFTNGAHKAKLWDKYRDAAMSHYRELFEPKGISFGSISPRASSRYDELTEQADLNPRPELLREGVVRDPQGTPVVGATVVLFPEVSIMPIVLNGDLSLRDTLDEVWTTTDREGKFRIESPAEGFRIAVLSAGGFALAEIPDVGSEAEINLPPLVRLDLAGVAGANQKVGLSIHIPGLSNDAAYFQFYDIELRDKPRALALPAGRITVSRSFAQGNGGSISIPAETFELPAGGRKSLKIPPKTLKEVLPKGVNLPVGNENEPT